jgi:hypothetical protein
MNPPLLPVLALEVGEIIGIIFLVISALGWFVKAIKGDGGAANPPVRRPDGNRLEIESFLEEISSTKPNRPPAKPDRPARPPERSRPAAAKTVKKPQKPPRPQQAAQPQKEPKRASPLSEQHLAKSNLGEGLRTHVSGYLQPDHIAGEVAQDLAGVLPTKTRAEIGRGPSVSGVTTSTEAKPIHPLIGLLQDPQGVRQAIVLQEVLQRPKALRAKS